MAPTVEITSFRVAGEGTDRPGIAAFFAVVAEPVCSGDGTDV